MRHARTGVLVTELLAVGLLGSAADIVPKPRKEGRVKWSGVGNSSEVPVVVAAAKAGEHPPLLDVPNWTRARAGLWPASMRALYPLVDEVPFSSDRKMMVLLRRVPSRETFEAALSGGPVRREHAQRAP